MPRRSGLAPIRPGLVPRSLGLASHNRSLVPCSWSLMPRSGGLAPRRRGLTPRSRIFAPQRRARTHSQGLRPRSLGLAPHGPGLAPCSGVSCPAAKGSVLATQVSSPAAMPRALQPGPCTPQPEIRDSPVTLHCKCLSCLPLRPIMCVRWRIEGGNLGEKVSFFEKIRERGRELDRDTPLEKCSQNNFILPTSILFIYFRKF